MVLVTAYHKVESKSIMSSEEQSLTGDSFDLGRLSLVSLEIKNLATH
jgi:hypothetical protein